MRAAARKCSPVIGIVLALVGCARPIPRACLSNGECGAEGACVASRCEKKGALPLLQKDERQVETAEVVPEGGVQLFGRFELRKGRELVLLAPWPSEERKVHEAFLLLRLPENAEGATLEVLAVRPAEDRSAEGADRVLLGRTTVQRGDESARLDVSRLPSLSRKVSGRYRLVLRAAAGETTVALEGAGVGPQIESYFVAKMSLR